MRKHLYNRPLSAIIYSIRLSNMITFGTSHIARSFGLLQLLSLKVAITLPNDMIRFLIVMHANERIHVQHFRKVQIE